MKSALASLNGWIAIGLATAGLTSLLVAARTGGGGGAEPPPPASTEMAATMIRVGLDASWLAAAGVGSQTTDGAISDAIMKHDAGETPLDVADADYASARPKHDALQRKIQSGLASQEDLAAFLQAKIALGDATAKRQAVLDETFKAGIAGLSEPQKEALATIRANRSWSLPVQYLLVERSEADWVKLRDYLDARRIYQESGEEVPGEVTSFLATIESDAAVSVAKASLDANLAAVQTAWNAAVTD